MPLNKSTLSDALKGVFKQALEESWTSDQVADGLADAIDTFVRSADVTSVAVTVKNASNVVIGSGTQTGVGKLQ